MRCRYWKMPGESAHCPGGPFSAEKCGSLRNTLEAVGTAWSWRKIQKIHVPMVTGGEKEWRHFPRELLWGDMGDFVRESAERTEEELMGQLRVDAAGADPWQEMTYDRQMSDPRRYRGLIDPEGWIPVWRNSRRKSRTQGASEASPGTLWIRSRRLDILQELVDDPRVTESW